MISLRNSISIYLVAILIFFLCIDQATAQQREIITGKVMVDSTRNISGIHVVNLTGETGTTTNEKGIFKMLAQAGDTLYFSSLQFEHKKVVVENSNLEEMLIVPLREKYNELDEVQIDDIKLSGVLMKDLDKVPKSIYEKLGIPFPKPRRTSLELAVQSANNGGPLLTIINTLNGKIKQLEKAEENNERSIMVNKGLNLVGKFFFVSQLNIEESEVINFLFYCVDDDEYNSLVNEKRVLQLIEYFELKVDSFKAWREID
ncbi:carboxypeptidase-like protein [Christiangramia gaetbulicola]|uniref:Carboxypeptidase-like protein n=1 Tax=Christiangramia gaetbulicola TaxID=703340 RepID=A0A2T6AE29_9FLAO|nr:carboxypeptidase-like regulatory domain-containing protein [Christiangramia gaetbulicola]PTX42083.1 carboxypeptidase-like protein [Christiangramia gaetbulicola]